MTSDLIRAAGCLADALAAENAALGALDLPRAAGMLDTKQRAAEAFIAARALAHEGAPAGFDAAAARGVAERLAALAEQNRRLLERAIAVQGHVIATIARAARPAALGYGAGGAPSTGQRRDAVTLSAKA
jgi:hypothetical protein